MDPELRAQLDRVLVGGIEKRRIVIADYDPRWPARFELERERIQTALGALALRIEHVGSTAVPGLAAKPVVDIQVSVAGLDAETAYVAPLETAGVQLRSRDGLHRYFRPFPGRPREVQFTSAPRAATGSGSTCCSATTCARIRTRARSTRG
jgi:GrpB-like predicted nucleotidyltransferase (UPF0157 family)